MKTTQPKSVLQVGTAPTHPSINGSTDLPVEYRLQTDLDRLKKPSRYSTFPHQQAITQPKSTDLVKKLHIYAYKKKKIHPI